MLDKCLIILNAPPNAGKDTIAEELCHWGGFNHVKFKAKLEEEAAQFYGVPKRVLISCSGREAKEVPSSLLGGVSYRQALIHVSEDVIKPLKGSDFFGRALASSLRGISVCSDGGFNEELDACVDVLGEDSVFVVRIKRAVCSFEGDSRGYLDSEKCVNYLDLDNDSNIESAVDKILNWEPLACFLEEARGVKNSFDLLEGVSQHAFD